MKLKNIVFKEIAKLSEFGQLLKIRLYQLTYAINYSILIKSSACVMMDYVKNSQPKLLGCKMLFNLLKIF